MADLRPGARIGTYLIEQRLGAGAMGEVHCALDEALGRRVALKILAEAHRGSAELRARFIREARAVATVNHPNIVQVFSVGELDGRPYFVMEYLAGPDLAHLVRSRKPLSDGQAVACLLGAARGLREAARRGLIHRDVKPANLVLTERDVKVTDFGLAKATDIGPGLTKSGIIVGTPDYIAPEQARGEELDARADIYGLGCTLFYLVTGRPPFRPSDESGGKYMEIVMRHLREPIPDLQAVAPAGCDAPLAGLCARMMGKQPAQRPGYDEIVAALEQMVARLNGAVPPIPASTPDDVSHEAPTRADLFASQANEGIEPDVPPRRRAVPYWLLALTAVSIATFLVGVCLACLGNR